MTYLMNCWYAGAFSEEVTAAPFVRTLLDRPIVLYRTEGGAVAALSDRCPHRFAPLHLGKVFGDSIRCPYHGLRFGPDGNCTHNPVGEGAIPRGSRIESYPVNEVDGIVWLWFGDEAPDESKIVRFEMFNDTARWACVADYMPLAANYTLVADNLLDLSHAEYIHPALASEGFNKRTQFSADQEGDVVIARNWRPAVEITDFFRYAMGDDAPDLVDHRSIVHWHVPSVLQVEVGVTPVGQPSDAGVAHKTAHLVTPETATTCHYFWKLARDFKTSDEEFGESIRHMVQQAFYNEDRPMIEAQQIYMQGKSFEANRPVWLETDAAGGRARKVLQKHLAMQEKAATDPVPA